MSPRVALAVLGDPLLYTRSPDLHRAGLACLGLEGYSDALRTPPARLGERLRELAARGARGANLTTPLKEEALQHLDRVSETSRAARSVNTVGFGPDGLWGDTTDGPGFVDWLQSLGRTPARERVLLLGSGGAARSLALALRSAQAEVAASSRDPGTAAPAWAGIPGVRRVASRSDEEREVAGRTTLLVNATPLAEPPLSLAAVPARALVVDLNYGERPTDWVLEARSQGREAWDGLGLLVFQARRALALWFARPVPVDPLARAVGWPR